MYPNCVWIFNMRELRMAAVLHQTTAIRSLSWHDSTAVLCVVTALPNVYVWQPSGCLCVHQPAVSDPRQLRWAPAVDTLLIASAASFCLAVPDWATY